MNLVIVESPTKAKTLSSFFGGNYRVEATLGHVRDLPEKQLGIEVEQDFKPAYVVIPSKKNKILALKKLAKEAAEIILATDPDREGEAIAYHVAVLLLGKKSAEVAPNSRGSPRLLRIIFHEITSSAIKEALAHPRVIDMKLVNAQQARRILDRLVGYKLSPLLWRKIGRRWLSAGRVQSVAVRLVVEREREREKFVAEEYWKISGKFQPLKGLSSPLLAELVAKNGEKYEKTLTFDLFDGQYKVTKTSIEEKAQAEVIISDLKGVSFKVSSLDKKEVKRVPSPPFTTSTLQQEANTRFGFSSKKTMSLAQRLYERGLITYHRTDSVFLSKKFLGEARRFIEKVYGEKYALPKPRIFKTKSKLAQEAHEAVRPTSLAKFQIPISEQGEESSPAKRGVNSKFQKDLTKDHLRLYDLIFKRAVACQAKEAVIDTTKIGILSDNGFFATAKKRPQGVYLFEAKGSVIKFDGFLKILGRSQDEMVLPELEVGEKVKLIETNLSQHFTNPPPRYTEASLVKTLERLGIGRPSTYAPTISTILSRQYVEKEEGKFVPALLGKTVNDFLVGNFSKIIDIPFTAEMEDNLDGVAQGKKEWVSTISEFYKPFEERLKEVDLTSEKVKLPSEETEEKCPKCQSTLVVKIGKFGKFLACSSFPKCDYTAPFLEKTGITCPQCGAELVIKKTRRGKRFYGCPNWPKCKFASWKKPKVEGGR